MNEKLREVGSGGRLRKGHGLDSLQQYSFQDDSLSQTAAFPGLAGLLEMNGSPQPSQGMAANEPDSQLGASVCLGSWQHCLPPRLPQQRVIMQFAHMPYAF